MNSGFIKISRTARYFTLQNNTQPISEIWIVAHGYGQLASYFIRHFEHILIPGTLIVAPEALSRFYVDEKSNRVGASWMTKEEREYEISDYVEYISSVYEQVKMDFSVSAHKLYIMGFSQGVPTICRWLALSNYKTDALICWAGFFPHDINWDQNMKNKFQLPIFSVVGDDDPYLNPDSMNQWNSFVENMDLKVNHIAFQGKHILHHETLIQLAKQVRNI
jgi:predicted esterase